MRVYVVMCEWIAGTMNEAKVSQEGYKTLEEAQAFIKSRIGAIMKDALKEINPYEYIVADVMKYTITEVSIK